MISGDSGCYGFKDDDGSYWPELLEALRMLHVVQVAHHAGHNYDFYNALIAAGFGQQASLAYSLISHAIRDPKRPSDAFAQFVAKVRRRNESPLLLFTSEPQAAKVRDFDELFAPQVPAVGRTDHGDVRMSYSPGANSDSWLVEKHSVRPP